MKLPLMLISAAILLVSLQPALAADISGVTFSETIDGSRLIRVCYFLSAGTTDTFTVAAIASSDGGSTWGVAMPTVYDSCGGTNVGPGILTGSHCFIWNAGTDFPGRELCNLRFRITGTQGGTATPAPLTGTWTGLFQGLIDLVWNIRAHDPDNSIHGSVQECIFTFCDTCVIDGTYNPATGQIVMNESQCSGSADPGTYTGLVNAARCSISGTWESFGGDGPYPWNLHRTCPVIPGPIYGYSTPGCADTRFPVVNRFDAFFCPAFSETLLLGAETTLTWQVVDANIRYAAQCTLHALFPDGHTLRLGTGLTDSTFLLSLTTALISDSLRLIVTERDSFGLATAETTCYVVVSGMVNVLVRNEFAGGVVIVDDDTLPSPATMAWSIGDTHRVGAVTPQYIDARTRATFINWEGGAPLQWTYVVEGPDTLTALFKVDYLCVVKKDPRHSGGWIDLDGSRFATDSVDFWASEHSQHTIEVSPLDYADPLLYTWSSWSDGGLIAHRTDSIRMPVDFVARYSPSFANLSFFYLGNDSVWVRDSVPFPDGVANMRVGEQITIVNSGNLPFKLGLNIISIWPDSFLVPGYYTSVDQYSLRAKFDDADSVSGPFTGQDGVGLIFHWADGVRFGPGGIGIQPLPAVDYSEKLWFQFRSPPYIHIYRPFYPETIRIRVTADVDLP